jgi:hypothetical protein
MVTHAAREAAMARANLKTTATAVSVADFIAAVPDLRRREEAGLLDALHRKVTGLDAAMWGATIVGYGVYHYNYDSGRAGTMARAGFSPRKAAAVVYLIGTCKGVRKLEAEALFARLGPHSTGKACLYIKRLDKIDLDALEGLVRLSWEAINERWPG